MIDDQRAPALEVRPEPAEPDDPRRLPVLVVDDNEVNRVVAGRLLQRLGYPSVAVSDGKQAVDITARRTFGLVLMDCHMPVMDGYEATRRIRQREGTSSRLPIVALTAHALDENRDKCLAVGMDDFLAKPVGLAELRRVLGVWVSPCEMG